MTTRCATLMNDGFDRRVRRVMRKFSAHDMRLRDRVHDHRIVEIHNFAHPGRARAMHDCLRRRSRSERTVAVNSGAESEYFTDIRSNRTAMSAADARALANGDVFCYRFGRRFDDHQAWCDSPHHDQGNRTVGLVLNLTGHWQPHWAGCCCFRHKTGVASAACVSQPITACALFDWAPISKYRT
jgi:hypothetical protein